MSGSARRGTRSPSAGWPRIRPSSRFRQRRRSARGRGGHHRHRPGVRGRCRAGGDARGGPVGPGLAQQVSERLAIWQEFAQVLRWPGCCRPGPLSSPGTRDVAHTSSWPESSGWEPALRAYSGDRETPARISTKPPAVLPGGALRCSPADVNPRVASDHYPARGSAQCLAVLPDAGADSGRSRASLHLRWLGGFSACWRP